VEIINAGFSGFSQTTTTGNISLSTVYLGVKTDNTTAGANAAYGLGMSNITGNVTLTSVVCKNNVREGIYLGTGITGLLTMSGITSSSNGRAGIFITGNTTSAGSSISNFTVTANGSGGALGTHHGISIISSNNIALSNGSSSSNTSSGIDLQGTAGTALTGITLTDVTTNNNGDDGVDETTNVQGTIYLRCTSNANGTAGQGNPLGAGDGFSCHDSCTAYYYFCVARDNLNAGFAHGSQAPGTNHGSIYNCLIWNNGSNDATMNRSNVYLQNTGNPGWDVKNSIIGQGYRCEIGENTTHYNTFSNNLFYPKDDDNFYSQNMTDFTSYADVDAAYKTNSLNADPLFVSTTDFRPRPGSPLIGAGTDLSATIGTTGADGLQITNTDGTWPIGAYGIMYKKKVF
jgi:hypothetical protein